MPFVTSQVLTGVGRGGYRIPLGSALKWFKRKNVEGTSLAVQGLRFHTSTEGSEGSIPGWGVRMLQAAHRGQKWGKKIFFFIKEARIKKEKKVELFSGPMGSWLDCVSYHGHFAVCGKGYRMKTEATSTT